MEIELKQVHLTILLVTAIFIIVADHDGLAYLSGKKELLDPRRVKRLHYTVMTGLVLMVTTGIFLFADAWGELIYETAFYVKILMVIALIANSFAIGNLMHLATEVPFRELSASQKLKLYVSGGISSLCWAGAAIIGYFVL